MLVKKVNIPNVGVKCRIPLSKGMFAIVDPGRFDELNRYYWRAVKSSNNYYAIRREIRNGQIITIRMHRIVAQTPEGQECHHENHNTLDNRLKNLTNMLPEQHRYIHGWREF